MGRVPRAAVRAVHHHAVHGGPREPREAIADVPGIDPDAIIEATGSDEVERAFEADREDARSAAGGATEFQGKSANYDGRVRYTAPSIRFTAGDRTLEAGGFQSIEAYDVCIANLDTSLDRRGHAESAAEILPEFPDGLTTAEVAQIMTPNNGFPDLGAAEDSLISLVGDGKAQLQPHGHDALWIPEPGTVTRQTAPGLLHATA